MPAYRTPTPGVWPHDPPADAHWLQPHMGTTTGQEQASRPYLLALQHVLVTLDSDAAWRTWWRGSGVLACELGVVTEGRLDQLRPSADIRKAGDHVRANFTCRPPAYGGRPDDLVPLAVDEVRGMFEVIREAIGLAALPPVPELPALPADAWEVEVTSKSLPSAPREQQGYLTLAQIQEFFG